MIKVPVREAKSNTA